MVMAGIFLIRDLFIWGPEFVADFFTSSEITSEKVSVGMIGIGCFLIFLGTRKEINEDI